MMKKKKKSTLKRITVMILTKIVAILEIISSESITLST
jgi:hypothetical protein